MTLISRFRAVIATLGLISVFAIAPVVSAQFDVFDQPCEQAPDSTVCKDAGGTQTKSDNSIYGPNGVLTKAINILSIIIGIAAVVVIIIAGIQYMLSTGDPTKVNNSKNTIIYAVVGLVIALFSQV